MSPAVTYPSRSLPYPVAADLLRSQYPELLAGKQTLTGTDWTSALRDGLPTPPTDMNGVAYNASLGSSMYRGKYHAPAPQYAKSATRVPLAHTVSNATVPQNYIPPLRKEVTVATAPVETKSQKTSGSNESIAAYLQIPSTINSSRGSLAEFAAQIACLFWFEKTSKLKAIEDSTGTGYSLVPEAIPSIGFQKWLTTILSTTQVSQNVILLALLFIYRLKNFNPGVRGKKGSEFRLMTIALMMGNKFLDDNTYTNKTWAEVSGISVHEIHIMEVEFLSNVRYNLFVSKEEWTRWHSKLGRFAHFFDRASRMPTETEWAPTTPVLQVSPTLAPPAGRHAVPSSPASKLPSPPATGHLQPQLTWNPLPNTPSFRTQSPGRHLPSMDYAQYSRKRSWDEGVEEQPRKRMAMPTSYPNPFPSLPAVSSSLPVLPPVMASNTIPLSVPTLNVPAPRLPQPNNYQATANSMIPQTLPPASVSQLPLPNVRAMSTVYNPSTTWPHQMPSAPARALTPLSLYNTPLSLPDPVRRQNPSYSVASSAGTISPATAFNVPTPPTHLSPSFFLVNRNSPYRPVRAVNTLLIPPPSAALHHPRHLSMDQMHYQPLGKTVTERRTGVLPYLHHDAWPQGQMAQPIFLPGQPFSTQ